MSQDAAPTPSRLRRLAELPAPVRDTVVGFVRVAGPRLVVIRRPRDVRALLRDPELVDALARDLLPVLESAIRTASTAPLPLEGRLPSHISASVSGAAGPAAISSAELAALFGGPQTLALSAPTAFAVQVVATVWETYVELSVIVHKLRRAGIDDPKTIQRALTHALVPGSMDLTKAVLLKAGRRLAIRLLSRYAVGWVPLVGPVVGAVSSNIDLHRAHRAAESAVRNAQKRR